MTYAYWDIDGDMMDSAFDFFHLYLPGFVRPASADFKETHKAGSGHIIFEVFNSDKKTIGYVTSSTNREASFMADDIRRRMGTVPDDVTGAAAPPVTNVQFIGDSATFDALPEIRKLAGQTAARFQSNVSRRPVESDFTDFAMQALALVYKASQEKGSKNG